ncbi:olfactory receptor 52B2-like [Mauremys mutica]|uniref:olfactory receptor 52B2-like n=1 Tax=Mauremys mutica TaxID=74926 RepID=UPI001D14355C|nr:olfactory receptor 52B2-like [Mauremys mutica]
MSALNYTSSHPATFVLLGIPGMEQAHVWLSIPFCVMYVVALLGNSVLLFTIITEPSLHEPMYIFLSMLTVADLLLSTTAVPKTLSVFWSLSKEISFNGCLTQMFFIDFIFITESAILLAMAFDRYVAICDPLRYTTVLTHSVIRKIAMAALTRSFCIMFPVVFLLKRLHYCGHNIMPHSYCEHIGVATLACGDITVNIWYGLATGFLSAGLDAIFIAVSYACILWSLFRLPSQGVHLKALNTCGSHICVILMFYTPAFFSWGTHRFGRRIPRHTLILLANLYVVIPPMLNPIVYGVRSRQVWEGAIRVFSR